MSRAASVLIALLLALHSLAHAQTLTSDPDAGIDTTTLAQVMERIEGKDKIRVSTQGEQLVVERPVADAAGIAYATEYGQAGRVAWVDVTQIDVQKRSPWLGAAVGAAAFGGAGLLFGAMSKDCGECDDNNKDGLSLMVTGAAIGAVVGFVFGVTRLSWSSVYIAEQAPPVQAMMSVRPGRVTVALQLRI